MAAGFLLILAAAVCGGAFALPMKYVRQFRWENTWLWAALFTMVVLPWTIALCIIPQPLATLLSAGAQPVLVAIAFGFGWGLGTVTFGIGVNMIGLSLGYAIIMGVNTAFGALLPMIFLSRHDLYTPGGHLVLLGVAVCIAGVALCGYAGMIKERWRSEVRLVALAGEPRGETILRGMAICVLSGVLSAFMNLGFSFSQEIAASATVRGVSGPMAGLESWIAVFAGSFPAVLLCCGWLQMKHKTVADNFRGLAAQREIPLALVMGLLWFFAIFLYGIGASRLGHMGTSVGWAINISASLLVANLLGFGTGEWRNAPGASVRWIVSGLFVVIASMVILAYGNSILATTPEPAQVNFR